MDHRRLRWAKFSKVGWILVAVSLPNQLRYLQEKLTCLVVILQRRPTDSTFHYSPSSSLRHVDIKCTVTLLTWTSCHRFFIHPARKSNQISLFAFNIHTKNTPQSLLVIGPTPLSPHIEMTINVANQNYVSYEWFVVLTSSAVCFLWLHHREVTVDWPSRQAIFLLL